MKRKILSYIKGEVGRSHSYSHLTSREQDVHRLAALGLTNTMIAHQLGISRASASSARRRAISKLEEANNAGAELVDTKESSLSAPGTVWGSPRVKAILERPEGSPIDLSALTKEEIEALASEAKGMWANHPEITDSVKWVRELWTGPSNSHSENN